MIRAKHFLVRGHVQGVGYRWFTKRIAEELNVKGYVRNLPNGDVEVFAQADEATLNRLKHELQCGPRSSQVDEVIEEDRQVEGSHSSFRIA
jgi:acylphosphatase